jgi:hypothetical protein
MTFVRRLVRFWVDFIVGDDWRLAAGVVASIPVAYIAARHGNLWWLLPLSIGVLLSVSTYLGARRPS